MYCTMYAEEKNRYVPGFLPCDPENKGWGLVICGKTLLLKRTESGFRIPETDDLCGVINLPEAGHYIGKYDGINCFCINIDSASGFSSDFEFVALTDITNLTGDPGLFMLAGTANHILNWERSNQYCGSCGHKTLDKKDERAKICPACGSVIYPRISPATITAVFRGNEILLAHNKNFSGNLHSLIAGFVEPGETLEQCAAREIREEIGIRVKNIRYFSSQPWPFPDSLMMAFTAEYDSGEIRADGTEITKAAWYSADNLPEIPSTDSVAGKIIRWYRDTHC